MSRYVIPFNELGRGDVELVGGKNSSLGEMLRSLSGLGVSVPDGYATTAQAYRDFLNHNGLAARIAAALADLDVEDLPQLARIGAQIRHWILETPFPPPRRRFSTQWVSAGRAFTTPSAPNASFISRRCGGTTSTAPQNS